MANNAIKILVILGPTASGKSDLAVRLAEKFNGEVVSADSRQVYRGLDIGTGKITLNEMRGIRHHCLDIADPKERFTVEDWRKCAEEAIMDIHSRDKLSIVCGGTGYYISALIDGIRFPEVESDPDEQKCLELKSAEELFTELEKLDPHRAGMMTGNGESGNKRRMARAILIARKLGAVPRQNADIGSRKYDALKIGITIPDPVLKERIRVRLESRIKTGMIEEAKKLHVEGLSFERMDELGLEYRYLAQYIQGKINKEEMINVLTTKIWQYARRQKTWWKKDAWIKWFVSEKIDEVAQEVERFVRR